MLRTLGLALLIAVVCHAQTNSAEDIHRGSYLFHSCQAAIRIMDLPTNAGTEEDLEDSRFCQGYLSGFVDLAQLIPSSSICVGEDATAGTLFRVYVAYMEKNPKLMDASMIHGVILALRDAYPCPAIPRPQK